MKLSNINFFLYVYRSTSTTPENVQKAKPKSRESSKAKSRDSSEEKMLSAKKPKTAEKSRQMTSRLGFCVYIFLSILSDFLSREKLTPK
jgi:hypothetical protein